MLRKLETKLKVIPVARDCGTISGNMSIIAEKRSGKRTKWFIAIGTVVAMALTAAVFAMIGNSEPCREAVQQANPDVERGFMISGTISTAGPSGHADLAIPLSGPKAQGTLYAVAEKSADVWKFETLELAVKGDPSRIDLLGKSGAKP
jgi:hypothetical protein